jgi:hypothetical protein
MASDNRGIQVDYNTSKNEVYLQTAMSIIFSSSNLKFALAAVESPDRPISAGELPSWVPDWTTKQSLAAFFVHGLGECFDAYQDSVRDRFHDDKGILISPDKGILTLRGVYVATVTHTHITELIYDIPPDLVKLIRYDRELSMCGRLPGLGIWPTEAESVTVMNTSWGPWWTEVGDIIIVATLCGIPLVLRRYRDDSYVFIGCCWLIDSQVEELPPKIPEKGILHPVNSATCR